MSFPIAGSATRAASTTRGAASIAIGIVVCVPVAFVCVGGVPAVGKPFVLSKNVAVGDHEVAETDADGRGDAIDAVVEDVRHVAPRERDGAAGSDLRRLHRRRQRLALRRHRGDGVRVAAGDECADGVRVERQPERDERIREVEAEGAERRVLPVVLGDVDLLPVVRPAVARRVVRDREVRLRTEPVPRRR